jgi:hypothetical protein
VLTINQGSIFMVTDLNGEIAAIFANGEPWLGPKQSRRPPVILLDEVGTPL